MMEREKTLQSMELSIPFAATEGYWAWWSFSVTQYSLIMMFFGNFNSKSSPGIVSLSDNT